MIFVMIPNVASRIASFISKPTIVRNFSRRPCSTFCCKFDGSRFENPVLRQPIGCSSTPLSYVQNRFKHKKTRAEEAVENDDDDDSDDEIDEPGSKIVTGHMASLRTDLVLKFGLGISRNKVETLFYESKIRVNGAKIFKKSQKLNIGDELDIIKGSSPANDNMLLVSRVVILNAKEHDDGDKLVVKMRRYKSLTIDNEDPEGT